MKIASFTNEEYADMHLIYRYLQCNAQAAAGKHAKKKSKK